MIKVAVAGAMGRMGSRIIRAIAKKGDMQLVAAVETMDSQYAGRDVGRLLGIRGLDVQLGTSDNLNEILKAAAPDVLVDFTVANVAVETARTAAKNKINLVIGTTGFDSSQNAEIKNIVKKNSISAVLSPNMATGVNIFFTIARATASIYEDCDVEIIEAHHKNKQDAPSGTAVRVGELVAEAMGKDLDKEGMYGRGKGMIGKRGSEIAFHAIRGGDIVGEHTVLFVGDGERIEVTHKAHSRQAFVGGTIKAIRFVNEKRDTGKVFSTFDVLGL